MAYNTALTAIPAGTYTTSKSADLINEDGKFIVVIVNVESVTTGTLTVTVRGRGRDKASDGTFISYSILATTALNGAGTTTLKIGPGLPASANASANDVVPLLWAIDAAKSDTSSWKFSVQYAALQ